MNGKLRNCLVLFEVFMCLRISYTYNADRFTSKKDLFRRKASLGKALVTTCMLVRGSAAQRQLEQKKEFGSMFHSNASRFLLSASISIYCLLPCKGARDGWKRESKLSKISFFRSTHYSVQSADREVACKLLLQTRIILQELQAQLCTLSTCNCTIRAGL